MTSQEPKTGVIAVGERVYLRNERADDVDRFIYWQTHGRWRSFDSPWDSWRDHLTPDEEVKFRQRFLDGCEADSSGLCKRAMIVTADERLIGFVNRRPHERFADLFLIGMRICEDDFLNRGLGTEALRLWLAYLFTNSTVHRIGAATWSFNPRAIALLKKLGFTHEGTERQVAQWQDRWQDRLYFGLLRSEWEAARDRLPGTER